jgi:GGDEF domain-containing protein
MPSLIAALESGEEAGELAEAFARERHSLGLAPSEVLAELLVVGRVLDRHGETDARHALDACIRAYFERVTAELADRASRDPLTGLLHHRAFHETVRREAARARRYRGRLSLAALLLNAEEAAVSAFLARLRERVPAAIGFSAGSATLTEGPADAEALFALADRRLYESKAARAA